jgi:hypothetical protein
MRIRLLLAATAAVTIAACSESSTAPHRLSPRDNPSADAITCRSGYHIATREDGTEYCEPDAGQTTTTAATTTTSTN